MSSVSSIGSNNVGTNYFSTSGMQRRQRPDADQMAADLFSKLDSSGKGYIEQSDLESALSGLSSSSTQSVTGSASASEIFSQLDGDSDGKITQDELTTSLKLLAESLDSQFNQARMQGAMPPPPADDAGFTKEELSSQLSEVGDSDSARSSLISKIVDNFDVADTNEDGKVSFQEAMAYDQSSTSATGDTSSSSSTANANAQSADAKIFRQIMELMRSYGSADSATGVLGALTSAISTSA